MNAALVELVDDDRLEVRQERILLETRGEHAFGRDKQLRTRAEAALETDLPANLFTDRPAALERDTLRDGARRDPARLQQNQRTIIY